MKSKFFEVKHKSKKSKARLGKITTAHGEIQTPAFVPVATKGTLKGIIPSLLEELKIQVAFVNTYHLVTHPGADIIEKAGGIHEFSRLQIPLMSDSGGFQVFSLAGSKRRAIMRGDPPSSDIRRDFGEASEKPLVEKISEDGVKFRSTFDGKLIEFTPEKSIEYQKKIGADLIMAFDECTCYPATKENTQKSMVRTHEWLKRCINASKIQDLRSKILDKQSLYGIIQGGMYEDLRKESAEFVTSQLTDGVAIGGVSVGETKKEMREQVGWVADYLPEGRPVHLLGVGHADDILDLIGYGIDTFDCVEPTRLARMGVIYQQVRRSEFVVRSWEEMDVLKAKYKNNLEKVDENCDCYVCQNFTKAYMHHLFKQKELLGYTLATYHNLWVMEKFMESIRAAIANDLI